MHNAMHGSSLPFASSRAMQLAIFLTATFLVGGFFVLFSASVRAANPGDVVITEFMADPTGSQSNQEWVEVKNNTVSALPLAGWKVDNLSISGSYSIPAGSSAVICRNSDIALNGGINCQYTISSGSPGIFTDSGDTIDIFDDTDSVTPITSVTYGLSNILDGHSTNFDGTNFTIENTNQYGDGDFGTPAGNTVSIATHSYPSIQSAVDAADPGNTISVAAGTYAESVTVDKTVSLVGSGATTVIQPAEDEDGITITADSVVIDSLKVSTSNSGADANIAISIEGTSGVQITNTIVETTGDKAMGIWVGGSSSGMDTSFNLTITKTTVTVAGEATGIYAAHSSPAHTGWVIGGSSANANTVTTALGNPVELYDVSESEVSYNALTTSASGGSNVIWTSELSDIANLVFSNNTVDYSSGSQVAFLTNFVVSGTTSVTTVTVSGNTFNNWGARGLRIGAGVTGVTASQNSFLGSGEALKNEDAAQVNAIGNWWGSANGPTHADNTYNASSQGNSVSDTVTFVPWLGSGTDTDTVTAGFQPNTANTVAPVVNGTSYYSSIQAAIDAASADDTITVSSGTFTEDLEIPSGKDGLDLSGSNATIAGVANTAIGLWPLATPNIEILSDGVKLHGFTIQSPAYESEKYSSGVIIGSQDVEVYNNSFAVASAATTDEISQALQTYASSAMPGVDVSGLNVHHNAFASTGGNGWGFEGIYINPDAATDTVTIKANSFTGKVFRAITSERANTAITQNSILTDLNPTDGSLSTAGALQGINITGGSEVNVAYNIVGGAASGNGFYQGIRVRTTATGTAVNNNIIMGNTTGVQNSDTESLDATKNYWGDLSGPEHASNEGGTGDAVSDNVLFDPWFNSAAKTALSDGAAESPALTSTTSGQAELPSGETALVLTNDTLLNLTSGLSTASGTSITVGGTTLDMGSFTSGNLAGVDMTIAKIIGDISVTITQAVKLQSGTNGTAITLTNSSVSNASVEIPDDTTVMAPAGWGGSMQPPKTGSSAGTAPSGFSLSGGAVLEVGDPSVTLLFDKPVKVALSNTSGSVAYKPAGSSAWNTISTICDDAANPTNISFPGECSIQSGNDTIIWTYHFTSFTTVAESVPGPSVNAGGAGGSAAPGAPAPEDESEEAATPEPAEETAVEPESEEPAPQVLGAREYADGTLIRASNKKIYAVRDGALRHILSLEELRASYAGKPIIDVSDSVIASYGVVAGARAYGQGELIRGSNKKVYVIESGIKRHIKSLEELAADHFRKPIHDVADSVLAQY